MTALSASNVTSTSADVSWSSTNTTASYLVEYGPHNFTPGTGLTATTQSTNITLTGLTHSTNYDLYVYTLCGATDTSIASQVLQFSTLCDAISTLPYSVDFENIMPNGSSATNILPNCWASVAFSGTQPHTVWGSSATYYGKASSSMLQRRFSIGFNRAARIIDQLTEMGAIGPANGAKPREILVDSYTFEEMFQMAEEE